MGEYMKGLINFFLLCLMSSVAYAESKSLTELITDSLGSQEDEMAICYLVKNDEVIKKQPCIVETQYGSGGWNATTYNIGDESITVESSADDPLTLNGRLATFLQRDVRNFQILNPNNFNEKALGCYRVENNTIDFCIKRQ